MLTYSGWHRKLRRLRGSAAEYTCKCGAPAAEWALKPEAMTDELMCHVEDLDAYDPLCRSCHSRRDFHRGKRVQNISKSKTGIPISIGAATAQQARDTPGSSREVAAALGIGYKVVQTAKRGAYDVFITAQLG